MYNGEWQLDHPKHGLIKVCIDADEAMDNSNSSLRGEVRQAVRSSQPSFSVKLEGFRKKSIKYKVFGKNLYSLKYIKGKETENDPYSRPSIELISSDVGIHPVFRGLISKAYFTPIDDAEISEKMQSIDRKNLARTSFLTFIFSFIALMVLPIVKPLLDSLFVTIRKLLPGVDVELPESKWTVIRSKIYEIIPWLDPATNPVYQTVIDYKLLFFPLFAVVFVLGFKILDPLVSKFWRTTWEENNLTRYL